MDPCKLEQDNKQIIKDDPAGPGGRLCPAMLSSKSGDRRANERCRSAESTETTTKISLAEINK